MGVIKKVGQVSFIVEVLRICKGHTFRCVSLLVWIASGFFSMICSFVGPCLRLI